MGDGKTPGAKGLELEELLRLYFLQTGFFAVRSVPMIVRGEEISDLDVWLYERPTGGSMRRRALVDAKFKNRPKASERFLWAKGVQNSLGLDGAYVATTDKRTVLREIAKEFELLLLDGSDLERIRSSGRITSYNRLSEEEFGSALKRVDKGRRTNDWTDAIRRAKSALINGLGAAGANRSLDQLALFAKEAVVTHPGSEPCVTAVRAAFFCAAVLAINLDYIAAGVTLRPIDERRQTFINSLRYGSEEKGDGLQRVRLATALVRQYLSNGTALATQLEQALEKQAHAIPAEIIADVVVKMQKADALFSIAREFESAAYSRENVSFDTLQPEAKTLMGALLDYLGCSREIFANATVGPVVIDSKPPMPEPSKADPLQEIEGSELGPLFDGSLSS